MLVESLNLELERVCLDYEKRSFHFVAQHMRAFQRYMMKKYNVESAPTIEKDSDGNLSLV